MLIIFPALLGALATAKEYEMGTIIQAYASSLTAAQWIAGKALIYVLVGVVEFVLCFALGMFVFGYRIPSTVLIGHGAYLRRRVRDDDGQCDWHPKRGDSGRADDRSCFLLLSGYLFAMNIPAQIRWFSGVPPQHYIQIVRNSILRDVG